MDYATLTGEAMRPLLRDTTFFTATDGNHGRGVAWTARELGCRAVVRMPKGTVQSRVENIRALGAEVTVEDLNYDGCVRLAAQQAEETTRDLGVQDTAWPGYEQIPLHIMQGIPDHGAGSRRAAGRAADAHPFAGGGRLHGGGGGGVFCANLPMPAEDHPRRADGGGLLFRSAARGEIEAVRGEMRTMMAGLACGEPSPLAWDILKGLTSAYVACEDAAAARGMRALARPLAADKAIISGESGAGDDGRAAGGGGRRGGKGGAGAGCKGAGAAFLHGGGYGPGELSRVMEEG